MSRCDHVVHGSLLFRFGVHTCCGRDRESKKASIFVFWFLVQEGLFLWKKLLKKASWKKPPLEKTLSHVVTNAEEARLILDHWLLNPEEVSVYLLREKKSFYLIWQEVKLFSECLSNSIRTMRTSQMEQNFAQAWRNSSNSCLLPLRMSDTVSISTLQLCSTVLTSVPEG